MRKEVWISYAVRRQLAIAVGGGGVVIFNCCGGKELFGSRNSVGLCVVCGAVTNQEAWHTASHSIFRLLEYSYMRSVGERVNPTH